MRCLYHLPLSAASRLARLALAEKKLDFDLKVEKVWDRREDFLALNPAGEVPVLIEPDGTALIEAPVIVEYLEEVHPEVRLIPGGPADRAEVRRLLVWFDVKFRQEVTDNLAGEKIMKRLMGQGYPNSEAIRAGRANIHYHLDYIAYLAERRNWLAGEEFSVADIAAGAHLSVIDYLGDVPWEDHPAAKEWYARIKSRPCFRPLLGDVVPGVSAPAHYADLDF